MGDLDQAPAPRSGGGALKWVIIGCVGCLVLGGIGVALMGGGIFFGVREVQKALQARDAEAMAFLTEASANPEQAHAKWFSAALKQNQTPEAFKALIAS